MVRADTAEYCDEIGTHVGYFVTAIGEQHDILCKLSCGNSHSYHSSCGQLICNDDNNQTTICTLVMTRVYILYAETGGIRDIFTTTEYALGMCTCIMHPDSVNGDYSMTRIKSYKVRAYDQ